MRPEVFVSAGEVSGDIHGAALLEALRRIVPEVRAFGIGGPALGAAGMERVAGIEELSLVGVAEAIPRLFSIHRLLTSAKSLLSRRRPRAVLLVDSPDFNLPLAAHARRLGLKVIYFIGPTVWAWRRGRLAAVKERVDLMLTILPFEEDIYRRAGVRVLYVGNPLVDGLSSPPPREVFLREMGIDDGADLFSLLPGSRTQEVRRLLPILAGAATLLGRRFPGIHFLVPAATAAIEGDIRAILGDSLSSSTVIPGRSADCLALSRGAIVTSGTSTLEAALRGTPFVTVYRLAPFSYLLGRLLVRTPWISLPNIIAGEEVVQEFIQGRCRPDLVAGAAASLLEDDEAAGTMRRRFAIIRERLGPAGSSERAAEAVAREAGLFDAPPPPR